MKAETFRGQSKEALEQKCIEFRKELFTLRMRPSDQQKTHLIRALKRNIARVKTLLTEQERAAS